MFSVLSALDTAKMMTDIQKWLEMLPSTDQMADQVHLLVVDGFLIFNYKWVTKICFYKNPPINNWNKIIGYKVKIWLAGNAFEKVLKGSLFMIEEAPK